MNQFCIRLGLRHLSCFWYHFIFSRHLLLVIIKIVCTQLCKNTRTAAMMCTYRIIIATLIVGSRSNCLLSEPPVEGNKPWFFPYHQKIYSSSDRHDGVCRWQPKDRRWFIFFMKLPFFVIELTQLETEYTHVVFLFITMRSRNLLQEFIFEHSRGLSSSRIQLLA